MTARTLLLVGGDLCVRTAGALDPQAWFCAGLRRRRMDARPGDRIHWLQADLGKPAALAAALNAVPVGAPGPITHILYAPAPDTRTPASYAQAYPLGLRALLDALPHPDQLQRCVLVDSTAVWGPGPDTVVDERTPPTPADFRGATMLDAETLLQDRLPGRGIALRLSGLYGPGRLRLADGLRAGRIIAPDGPGHWANRIHIDDAARACAHLLALADPQPCYIGTDDHPMPTAAFYDALAQMAGGPAPARESRPPSGKRLSNARLRASGWQPAWPDMLHGYAASLAARHA